jgi:serine/threonine-protein kinase
MERRDTSSTRTAEPRVSPSGQVTSTSAPDALPEPARTEPIANRLDAAALSFALGRERVLSRLDHSASVVRLRRALIAGLLVWLGAGASDLFVAEFAHEADLWTLFTFRGIGALVVLVVLVRLWRRPEPSVPTLWSLDVIAYTTISTCISLNTTSYRGLDSPYAAGILVVLLSRGATTLAPWKHGAWQFAGPTLAYPVTMLVVSFFDARIKAQLRDPAALGAFASMMFMILVGWALVVFAGHNAWRLRREAVQARNIGRYELERHLGSGGMGDVWAAFDRTLRQRVALKTVYGHRPGSSLLVRLEREVRALAELTHPNTVRVFDYGVTEDGLWYYAMELLEGENLRQLVARTGPLPLGRLLHIARQALRALGEAHDKGIIHRDIKPENVFVARLGGETDVVKLLDFGIAKTTSVVDSTLTNTGHVAGTPAYMPPETILGRAADVRSDIYSFGALLYYVASARLAFPDKDPEVLFAAHLERPVPPISSATLAVPSALEQIVKRCMAKDPAERYGSTRDLLEALQQLEQDAGGPDLARRQR